MQCAIPVFEGLFIEPYDSQIQDLLFVLAYWHGLAKLRMHTEVSINILSRVTVELGRHLRIFAYHTSAAFDTKETQREADARRKKGAKQTTSTSAGTAPSAPSASDASLSSLSGVTQAVEPHSSMAPPSFPHSANSIAGGGAAAVPAPSDAAGSSSPGASQPTGSSSDSHPHPTSSTQSGAAQPDPPLTAGRRQKKFNLNIYKLHVLGYYPTTIRWLGTTDSYSTERVSAAISVFCTRSHIL